MIAPWGTSSTRRRGPEPPWTGPSRHRREGRPPLRARTAEPSAGAGPGPLTRVGSALAGARSRRALGWVLLVGLGRVARRRSGSPSPGSCPRSSSLTELAQGQVTAYRLVTVDEDGGGGGFSGPYRIDVAPVSDEDLAESLDGTYGGGRSAWRTGSTHRSASLRVLDPNGLSSDAPAGSCRPAGPPGCRRRTRATFVPRPPSQRVNNAGALLLIVSLCGRDPAARARGGHPVVLVLAARRAASVGVAVFAVAELLRPSYEPEGRCTRRGSPAGGAGWPVSPLGLVLSIAGGLLPAALTRPVADLVPPRLTSRAGPRSHPRLRFPGCRPPA